MTDDDTATTPVLSASPTTPPLSSLGRAALAGVVLVAATSAACASNGEGADFGPPHDIGPEPVDAGASCDCGETMGDVGMDAGQDASAADAGAGDS